jgi:hypothetical protein
VRVEWEDGEKKFCATTTAILMAFGATRDGTAKGNAVGVVAGAGRLIGTHMARLPMVRSPTKEPLPKCVRGKALAASDGVAGKPALGGAMP